MDFCKFCLDLTQWIKEPLSNTFERKKVMKKTAYRETAAKCQLCEIILNNLHFAILRDRPVHLSVVKRRSYLSSQQGLGCTFTLSFYCEDGALPKLIEKMPFALWADRDSAASKSLTTRPPILNNELKDIYDLTTDWLSYCNKHHMECAVEEESPLPTRVLEISGSPESPSVRLIETNGTRGSYCALSHCWGQEEQPLKTTRATLQAHLTGIPMEQLPKTYREAIMLAQGIGISFVWIDSLCIIQLDPDWYSEAKDMGNIYRNATLVIAAAGSKDWKEGLFVTERPYPTKVTMTDVLDGVVKYSFNIALLPRDEDRPDNGPLFERAWAFQEWYLARRLLFFMQGGITWQCNESELSERGEEHELGLYRQKPWLYLLASYCSKKLTYHTDRLHALRGIVTEVQKTRQDQFLFEYGIWEDRILEQILWRRTVPDSECRSLELPTWSWAANGDAKWWVLSRCPGPRYFPEVCELTSSGTISAVGHLLSLNWRLHYFSNISFQRLDDSLSCFESGMLPGFDSDEDVPAYIIWDDSSDDQILGIAVFDDHPILHATCFLVASAERDSGQSLVSSYSSNSSQRSEFSEARVEHDISNHSDGSFDPENGKNRSSGNSDKESNYTKTNREAGAMNDNEDTRLIGANGLSHSSQLPDFDKYKENPHMLGIDDLDFWQGSDMSENSGIDEERIISKLLHLKDTTNHVYFTLLLDPIGDRKFKRVGLAMFYPYAWDMREMELSRFEIV